MHHLITQHEGKLCSAEIMWVFMKVQGFWDNKTGQIRLLRHYYKSTSIFPGTHVKCAPSDAPLINSWKAIWPESII
jgi:hypothetical protein